MTYDQTKYIINVTVKNTDGTITAEKTVPKVVSSDEDVDAILESIKSQFPSPVIMKAPKPKASPTAEPTVEPTVEPSVEPDVEPTPEPSEEPDEESSENETN